MKNIKINIKVFLFLSILFTISSCNDNFTEIERDFLINEDIVDNLDDVDRLLSGAYDALTYRNVMSRNTLSSDELRIGLGNRGQGLQEHAHTISSNSGGPAALWNSQYNTIDNAVRALAAAEQVSIEPGEEARRDELRGQALAISAFAHFELLRAFAANFDANTPGVIIVDEPLVFGSSDLSQPRATVGEVIAHINASLDLAENLIPASLSGDYERFNLDVVNALRARMALYLGNWAEAVTYSTAVINNVPVITGIDYFNMFRANIAPGEGPSETVFQIEADTGDDTIGSIWNATNFDVFFSMSTTLFGEIQLSGADRFNTNLDLETAITPPGATLNELIIGKYLGSAVSPSLNHIKVFRTSEMVLIRAEANARLGNLAAAEAEINNFRTQRGSGMATPSYNDMTIATLDVLRERNVELAFEGHRLDDLKRFNLPVERDDADCSNPDRSSPTSCGISGGSFLFTYPIPFAEISANPGISDGDQNPGY